MPTKLCSLQPDLFNVVVLHGNCSRAKLKGYAPCCRRQVHVAAPGTPRRATALAAAVRDQAPAKVKL